MLNCVNVFIYNNAKIHKNHIKCDKVDTTVCSAVGNRLRIKGIGPQTIVCALYESLHVAEQFATNFMKINQGIGKLLRFENFDGPNPERGCEGMTSLTHNHGIIICHFHAY